MRVDLRGIESIWSPVDGLQQEIGGSRAPEFSAVVPFRGERDQRLATPLGTDSVKSVYCDGLLKLFRLALFKPLGQ